MFTCTERRLPLTVFNQHRAVNAGCKQRIHDSAAIVAVGYEGSAVHVLPHYAKPIEEVGFGIEIFRVSVYPVLHDAKQGPRSSSGRVPVKVVLFDSQRAYPRGAI